MVDLELIVYGCLGIALGAVQVLWPNGPWAEERGWDGVLGLRSAGDAPVDWRASITLWGGVLVVGLGVAVVVAGLLG